MRRKRRICYTVTAMGGYTMWDHALSRWIRMDDPLYERKGHKGYSSHKRCMTKKAAMRCCVALSVVAEPCEEVIITRFTWPKGKRRMEDFIFNRSFT